MWLMRTRDDLERRGHLPKLRGAEASREVLTNASKMRLRCPADPISAFVG